MKIAAYFILVVVFIACLSGCFLRKDTIPPEVVSTAPDFGLAEVSLDSLIAITFAEPMKKETVEAAFVMFPETTGEMSWKENTFYFSPLPSLLPSTSYEVKFKVAPQDLAGNRLPSFSLQFSTATPLSSVYSIYSFKWFPNSLKIVYNSDQSGKPNIWTVALNGLSQRRLVPSEEDQMDPNVSPDGEMIAYVTAMSAEISIWQNMKERFIRPFSAPGSYQDYSANPTFSGNSKHLAFYSVQGYADAHSDIYQVLQVLDLSQPSAPLINVSPPGETDWLVGFSGDGKKLFSLGTYELYNHSRDFRYDLWEADILTEKLTRRSSGGQIRNFLSGQLNP
ncbi:MAG: Ig-like domain-containing protein, partial [bacterium]|nr:Ig-like domain-containing protein [bacterium]